MEIDKLRVDSGEETSAKFKPFLVNINDQQKAKSALVVGASGFIGGETLEKLFAKDGRTLSYDIIEPKRIGINNGWIKGDILDLSSIRKVCHDWKIDTVLHFVGLPVVDSCQEKPHLSFLLNVVSVQNTLEAMRLADIKKILFASSASIYGVSKSEPIKEVDLACPNTIYGHHKLIAEDVIKAYSGQYGFDYAIFRIFNVYGAQASSGRDVLSIFIRRAIRGEHLIVKGPKKFRDFIHVKDVAKVFVEALDKKAALKKTINVGSGTKTTLMQLAQMVKRHFPKTEVKKEPALDDGTGLYADTRLLKEILGFKPIAPEEGINEHASKYVPKE